MRVGLESAWVEASGIGSVEAPRLDLVEAPGFSPVDDRQILNGLYPLGLQRVECCLD